jgi:hypothetical protein
MTTRREFLAGTAKLGVTAAVARRITPAAPKARFNVSDGRFVLDGEAFGRQLSPGRTLST